MNRAEYLVAFLREFGKRVDVDVRNALHCAEAAYEDDPSGDPEEAAQSEADEWLHAS